MKFFAPVINVPRTAVAKTTPNAPGVESRPVGSGGVRAQCAHGRRPISLIQPRRLVSSATISSTRAPMTHPVRPKAGVGDSRRLPIDAWVRRPSFAQVLPALSCEAAAPSAKVERAGWPSDVGPNASLKVRLDGLNLEPAGKPVAVGAGLHTLMRKIRTSEQPQGQHQPGGAPALARKVALCFSTHTERRSHKASLAAEKLFSVLPAQALEWSMGDISQVPDGDEQRKLIVDLVRKKGGPEGTVTAKATKAWCLLQDYVRRFNLPNLGLPASPALLAAVVRAEMERARASGRGSQGGRTVGKSVRDGFLFLQRVLSAPLMADTVFVEQAAVPPPDALPRVRRHAGSIPIKVMLQLEHVANLSEWSVARVMARAFLVSCAVHHIRLNDALNAILYEDQIDPENVICGRTKVRSKDGVPLELFAPAEGFLGKFTWFSEHFSEMKGREHAIPSFHSTAKGRVSAATHLLPGVAAPDEARKTFAAICKMPPLAMSDEEFKELGITTHSFHASGPDMGRYLSFSLEENRQLGHWLRDRNAPSEIPVAAPGVRGGGRAVGAPNLRGTMMIRYTQGSGRRGERAEQLKVRTKLLQSVQEALVKWRYAHSVEAKQFVDSGRPWWLALPSGIEDWSVLES